MIKPFRVIEQRIEADGKLGVIYEVWRVTATGPGRSRTDKLQGYIQIPEGQDTDEFLFQELSKVGWF